MKSPFSNALTIAIQCEEEIANDDDDAGVIDIWLRSRCLKWTTGLDFSPWRSPHRLNMADRQGHWTKRLTMTTSTERN